MIQEADLQELAELVSKEAQILSLYLNADPHRRSKEEHKLNLRRLLAHAAQQGASHADIERVERFFDHEYDRQGRGVACFSCQEQGFWRAYPLLVSVEDYVFVGSRPYITPLSDVWDAYGRFGVIMVDRAGARVFIYHLGALEDSAGTLGAEVRRHKQGGWAAQKLQRYEDQEAKQNLKDAAEWADGYLREHKATRVVLSGSEDNLAQLRELLPRDLQDKVVGHISLDMTASPAQVWDRAFDVTLAAQRQAEADLLDRLVTVAHKGGAGALGLDDTLAAMQQGRVYQLLVDRESHQPGHQCSLCQSIVTHALASCPYCGGPLVETADIVNLAVQKAVDAGLKVSVLDHSPQTADIGGIAAVLRY
jgi:peptide subunit release factor 1 (eRF1)